MIESRKKKEALTQDNTFFRDSQDNGNMNFVVRASTAERESENPETMGEHVRIMDIMK